MLIMTHNPNFTKLDQFHLQRKKKLKRNWIAFWVKESLN